MFLTKCLRRLWALLLCQWLIAVLIASAGTSAWGQEQPASPPNGAGGITVKICKPPPMCFGSAEAKRKWAEENNCRFLEDVCEGEQRTDGELNLVERWIIKPLLEPIWDFAVGFVKGMGQQIDDLWALVSDPLETIQGLGSLIKSFIDDPKGTAQALAVAMGQEVVDDITRATQCGSYDLGLVLGRNINPAVLLKIGSKIAKFSGPLTHDKLARAAIEACASFVAGTPILSADGSLIDIDRVTAGQSVLSRNTRNWSDAPQQVRHTFSRQAPGYRELITEDETYYLTDEHPLWVQGYGWKPVRDIAVDEVIAAQEGDVLVLGNRAVAEPVQVFNFEVQNTPSYFVGERGIWAHNASCPLPVAGNGKKPGLGPKRPAPDMSGKTSVKGPDGKDINLNEPGKSTNASAKGYVGERLVRQDLENAGWKMVHGVGDDANSFTNYRGKQGIDAIYEKDGKYIIVEVKTTGAIDRPTVAEGCKGDLCLTKNGDQMSENWIKQHLNKLDDSPENKKIIDEFKQPGKVERVIVEVDGQGSIKYGTVKTPDGDSLSSEGSSATRAVYGGAWTP
ncbi:polymorphic toxin-type HINT domain-containing protein [Comamonas nitrativorans]|uniref:Polymorphic toxin-type HINT domain-containing protein n=1 Tax=Comamonas nitrativorans TaxID=108437 RepID=A0ABV9H0A9_9BURK